MKILAADMTASQRKRIFMEMLSLFMFFGVAFGTILVIKDRDMSMVAKAVFHQNLVKSNEEQNVFRIFAGSFLPVAVTLVFQLLCGFFAFGQLLSVSTLFFRGMAGGISASLIYLSYGIKGFAIILITLLPVMIFDLYILVLGARESVKLSNTVAFYIAGKKGGDYNELRLYMLKYLVLMGFAFVSSVLDSILTYIFIRLI